jgi:hypothetical protein
MEAQGELRSAADASAGVLLDHSDVLVALKRSFMTL